MSLSHKSPEDRRPRKKPRKGTHSCLECKRRKVRCVFPSDTHSVCVECAVRGNVCIGQEYEDRDETSRIKRQGMRDRIGRLEAVVESLTQTIAAQNSRLSAGDVAASRILDSMTTDILTPSVSSSDSSIEAAGQLEHAPVLSLFDNDVLQRRDDDDQDSLTAQDEPLFEDVSLSSSNSATKKLPARYQKISKELLTVLPSRKVMKAIFDETQDWWSLQKTFFPSAWGTYTGGSFYSYAMAALSTGHPTTVAYILVCLAISLMQLPASIDRSRLGLPLPIEDLMSQYIAAVDRLVTSNDELIGTIEGLQCVILQGKYHVDLGQPRRAWLLIRRAVSVAQLMGLHRAPRPPKTGSERARATMRRSVWWIIYLIDRYLSLLLGLPYSTIDGLSDLEIDESGDDWASSAERYRRKLAVISGAVTDMNHTSVISTTAIADIDQRLNDLAQSFPDGWWEPELAKAQLSTSEAANRLAAQFWHFQVQALAHLRPALRSATEPRYEHNRAVCIASSREMLNRYFFLRQSAGSGTSLCKVVDFQAFTATVLLLLNLLGYGMTSHKPADQHDSAEDEDDWRIVDEMIEIMRLASGEVGSIVASQALKVLETLRLGRNRASDIWEGNTVKLVVPYLGTICIGQGSRLQRAPSNDPQPVGPVAYDISLGAVQGCTAQRQDFLLDDPFLAEDDGGIISFSNVLALAPAGTEQGTENQGAGADSLFADNIGFDLDQDWSWFMNGGAMF